MKEQVYDAEIAPHMAAIIAICKREKIAMIADFSLDNEGLHATTVLLEDEFEPAPTQMWALRFLQPQKGGV